MAQTKGQTGNPNGRPKGTPNKTTTEMREIINSFLSDNIEKLQDDFDKLEPPKRFEAIDKLLKYVLPSRSEIKQDVELQQSETIQISFGKKQTNLSK
jgi:hypothetical protein